MSVRFGSGICSNLATSEEREWLITNGIGGYGAGTISGILTRRYHGLLIAALKPPLGRTLMLSKLNETVIYNNLNYDLYSDRWADQTIFPHGYSHIEKFYLVGTTPVWLYKLTDALLEKRVWMRQGENTTYIRYTFKRGSSPLTLSLEALVNYRDYHGDTHSNNWQMQIQTIDAGIQVKATPDAANLYLLATSSQNNTITWQPQHTWYHNFSLAIE
ncbi:MAG: glycogen debranching enzyme N-terminal domain-containing protein, partial [Waterburya sp.]